jgi:hypothetical protein
MIDTIFISLLVIGGIATAISLVLFLRLVVHEKKSPAKPDTVDLTESNHVVYGARTIILEMTMSAPKTRPAQPNPKRYCEAHT